LHYYRNGQDKLVIQVINILVFILLYIGVLYFQFSFVERLLRTLRGPTAFDRAIDRVALSVLHSAIGLAVCYGVELLLNAMINRDYREPILGPYWMSIPVDGGLFGFLVPWLPVLWDRPDK
jgi:hypothetical protein